jgi:hypothetical protein
LATGIKKRGEEMKFKKKPLIIDGDQWLKLGDNPDVTQYYVERDRDYTPADEKRLCPKCHNPYFTHGSVPTLEGKHIVCPGDWILTGVKGEKYPIKPDILKLTYDEVK